MAMEMEGVDLRMRPSGEFEGLVIYLFVVIREDMLESLQRMKDVDGLPKYSSSNTTLF